jgi:hypothetical protein
MTSTRFARTVLAAGGGALGAAGLLMMIACAAAPQTSSTPKAGDTLSATIVDPYLQIQQALSDDSIEGVKAHAGEIATAATALGAPAMKIDTAAVQLASTTDIEAARDKFGALSLAIENYMTGLKLKPPDDVKVAYCPMVLKPWLQKAGTIDNPYYGKSMLTCGNFK